MLTGRHCRGPAFGAPERVQQQHRRRRHAAAGPDAQGAALLCAYCMQRQVRAGHASLLAQTSWRTHASAADAADQQLPGLAGPVLQCGRHRRHHGPGRRPQAEQLPGVPAPQARHHAAMHRHNAIRHAVVPCWSLLCASTACLRGAGASRVCAPCKPCPPRAAYPFSLSVCQTLAWPWHDRSCAAAGAPTERCVRCSDNYLGVEGAKVLAEALRKNRGLRELQVRAGVAHACSRHLRSWRPWLAMQGIEALACLPECRPPPACIVGNIRSPAAATQQLRGAPVAGRGAGAQQHAGGRGRHRAVHRAGRARDAPGGPGPGLQRVCLAVRWISSATQPDAPCHGSATYALLQWGLRLCAQRARQEAEHGPRAGVLQRGQQQQLQLRQRMAEVVRAAA